MRISNDRIQPDEDVEQHAMSCASNGTIELFIQPYSPRSALCVLGSTPAADEARFLAERLRIRLADAPDEAPVVLVATQGQGDEDALESALRQPGAHVLMIASRRKAERLREVMRMRGIDEVATRAARLRRRVRTQARRRRGKSRWSRSSASSRCCAAGRRVRPATTDCASAHRCARQSPRRLGSDEARPPPGAKFINPVCGIAVDMAAPKHVEDYDGVAYYFCCDGCLATFRQNPAKYAAIHHGTAGIV